MNPPTQTSPAPLAPHNVTPLPVSQQRFVCSNCDATLDNQQRYCLNCGARSGYTTNPAVDYIADRQRKRGIVDAEPVDNGIGGTGVTKRALPWLVGSTLIALILGVFLGGLRGDDNNDALLAALAAQRAAAPTVAAGASTATGATITSDWTLDTGYAVQVATVPTGSDQAAVDAAKQAATSKGASDVGVVNPTDFTIDPDPAGAYVIYSGEFKKKGEADAALKKLKAKFGDAKVVKITSSAAGVETEIPEGESSAEDLTTKGVSKEKAKADSKKVKEINKKTGDDFVESQEDVPDVIINDPAAGGQ